MAELKRCPECGGVATVIHMYDTYDRADFGWDAGCGRYRAGDGLHTKKMKVSGLPSKQKQSKHGTGGRKMAEHITREAAIAYIREQSEECQKAFEELGGESGIYADAYNDLAEDFYSIPAADVAPVVHGRWVDGKCSNCGVDIPTDDLRDVIFESDCHFCYSCGAKMDRGECDAVN